MNTIVEYKVGPVDFYIDMIPFTDLRVAFAWGMEYNPAI